MSTSRPKCQSKVIPCPAGDRCPQHRGLLNAIQQAAENQNLGEFFALKDEEASKEDLQKKADFLSSTSAKRNRKGEIVVELPKADRILGKASFGSGRITFFKKGGSTKVVLPAPHPADVVDKTVRIKPMTKVFADDQPKTETELMQESVDLTYDGNVKISTKYDADTIIVDLQLQDDYKNRGVETHVLSSVVIASRTDLYTFYGTGSIPYSAYKESGFEPNPYYWAGKEHTESGVTYPTVKELDNLVNFEKNTDTYLYSGLVRAKYKKDYPYLRQTHGRRFLDRSFYVSQEKADNRIRDRILRKREIERNDRLEAAKNLLVKNPSIDIS